jgi:hypothetical protein
MQGTDGQLPRGNEMADELPGGRFEGTAMGRLAEPLAPTAAAPRREWRAAPKTGAGRRLRGVGSASCLGRIINHDLAYKPYL